jgi:ABC-type transport system involved in multi-copper enzyme maturation permease subunit
MMSRMGLGPVFFYEWLIAARRWQMYAIRALFLLILLAVLFFVWWMHITEHATNNLQDQAKLGSEFFFAIIGTQLTLVLLAAPAATAGSVCQDKARGTLTHLLVTDLSNVEIVLGKLGARLLPVLGLLLCTFPVLALNILLGGVDPVALAGAILITLGVAVVGCALALTLSVWGHKTHEVLLINYLIWTLFLLIYPIYGALAWALFGSRTTPGFLYLANPFCLAFAPYDAPGTTTLFHCVGYLAICLAVSIVLVGVAVLAVRSVAVRHLGTASRRRRPLFAGFVFRHNLWSLFSPPLDANPVLWREWHRKRTSPWLALVWITYAVLAGSFTLLAIGYQMTHPRGHDEMAVFANAFVVSLGLLLVSVMASTSLAEERVRGTLDVLLTTPMSTPAIVWGKWWGAFRTIPLLALLPALMTLGIGALEGPAWEGFVLVAYVLACGAALTSLGLALATWVPRLGRAVACCVTAYVLATVAWPFAMMALFARDEIVGPIMAVGSPFFAGGLLTIRLLPGTARDLEHVGLGGLFWTAAYLVLAAVLYLATLRTFDRSLGRVTDDDTARPRLRPPRPIPASVYSSLSLPPPHRVADAPPVVEPGD